MAILIQVRMPLSVLIGTILPPEATTIPSKVLRRVITMPLYFSSMVTAPPIVAQKIVMRGMTLITLSMM